MFQLLVDHLQVKMNQYPQIWNDQTLQKINKLIQRYKHKQLQQIASGMKKKQQITIHKNLQSGKIPQTQHRQSNHFTSSNRALVQKNSQKQSRKLLSQQKIPSSKRSQQKNSSKESRRLSSSIGKNEKGKKKKGDSSNKGSKKSLRCHNSQQENWMVSGTKNIYTTNVEKTKKKKQKYTEHTSSEGHQQQPSITSISQSIKSQGNRLQVDQLVQEVHQEEFSNLHKLKLHMLNFIFKNRIIRDQQYDRLYEMMVEKFPDKEEICRSVLFQIVSSLDN